MNFFKSAFFPVPFFALLQFPMYQSLITMVQKIHAWFEKPICGFLGLRNKRSGSIWRKKKVYRIMLVVVVPTFPTSQKSSSPAPPRPYQEDREGRRGRPYDLRRGPCPLRQGMRVFSSPSSPSAPGSTQRRTNAGLSRSVATHSCRSELRLSLVQDPQTLLPQAEPPLPDPKPSFLFPKSVSSFRNRSGPLRLKAKAAINDGWVAQYKELTFYELLGIPESGLIS